MDDVLEGFLAPSHKSTIVFSIIKEGLINGKGDVDHCIGVRRCAIHGK